ncbi:MAG: thermosome subunit alpha [Thermoplasmata archaeon]
MNGENQPVIVLSEDIERQKGKDAQEANISAAKALADSVKATLGPKGMDKMLVNGMGDVVITNDGVTMLKEMDIEHPAAKMVVEVAEAQDDECGDGTTTAVVLAGELLTQAQDMIDSNVHPSTIARGYRKASEKARAVLEELKKEVDSGDEEVLRNTAVTAMTGKAVDMEKENLADMALKAVKKVADKVETDYHIDLDDIKIVKKAGASMAETEIVGGVILDKEPLHQNMPTEVKDAKILLLNTPLEVKETETSAGITISDTAQMQRFIDEEERSIRQMVEKIKEAGAKVVLCQKGIGDLAQHYLAKEDILALRRVKKSDMKKLVRATGGNIVTSLNDMSEEDLGEADKIGYRFLSDSHMTVIEGTKMGKSVSLILRGGSEHVVDELERALEDALKVIAVTMEDGHIVPGGGAVEVELICALEDYASTIDTREQMAVKAFSKSLRSIPMALADNAGLDGMDVLMELTAIHEKEGMNNYGVNVDNGDFQDMMDKHIYEPLRVKEQALRSASELAEMVLMIDDVIAAKGGDEEGQPPQPGAPPGMM